MSVYNIVHMPWIVHDSPNRIEVLPCAAKLQILGDCEFDIDMIDVLIRRLRQVDQKVYRDQGNMRWRHFVESDFLVSTPS